MAHTAQRQTASPAQRERMTAIVVAARPALGLRRLVAWALEASLLIGGAAIPWAIGEGVRRAAPDPGVPLNPAVAVAQGAIARTLNQPRQPVITHVPPLTNLLWFSALGLPLVLGGSQLYWLARSGKTLPKYCLGLQVLTPSGAPPGVRRALQREAMRWGVPSLAAYGLWIASGAFPHVGLLGGLVGLALVAEGNTIWLNRPRRAWHDQIAGTQVMAAGVYFPVRQPSSASYRDVTVADAGDPIYGDALSYAEPGGGLTSVILLPPGQTPAPHRQWLRQHPALVLGGLALGGLSLLLVGVAGTLLYTQQRLTQQSSQQQTDQLFLALVDTLSTRASRPEEQRAAILALASSQDPRAIPLLVDLLSQTSDGQTLDALQQGLVTLGPATLPHLQRLNQALATDIAVLPADQRWLAQQRQQTVKRTLAKLLTLYSGQLAGVNLSQTHLGKGVDGPDAFTLVLNKVDLAGVIWQGSVLTGSSFRGARFYSAGPDQRPDTYDDWAADLSGSDLTEADLSGANLRYGLFQGSSLLRASLNSSQAAFADFSKGNLGSAQLINADLSQAQFRETSLVGADLTESNLSGAILTTARLHQAQGLGTNFSGSDLTRAEGHQATFSNANFSGAILSGADLSDSQFTGADFQSANLENARLRGANLQGANFQGANLNGTDFQNAVFFQPEGLPLDSFIEAVPNLQPGSHLAGVDFSRAKNLAADQLAYICGQGGIHPACASDP
jgi:uncharacterized protein YjbI with pentapeptide repeats/uncharacterized RDD family membrane protein YckC